MDLVERVTTAAETALADHQYASFIDVLTGMGLLHNVQMWHNGAFNTWMKWCRAARRSC